MNNLEYQLFYRRHLPHYQPPGAMLFITFRLADSIPVEILQRLLGETQRAEAKLASVADLQERARQADEARRRIFGKWDKALDTASAGPFWLRDRSVLALMRQSLLYRHGKVYDLDAFCIMPNHVHLLCTPLPKSTSTYHAVSAIMHSLKLYTARRANQLLGRIGVFWQHENYDHVVRDQAEWRRIVNYVINNPVKAGLVQSRHDWKGTYCKYPL